MKKENIKKVLLKMVIFLLFLNFSCGTVPQVMRTGCFVCGNDFTSSNYNYSNYVKAAKREFGSNILLNTLIIFVYPGALFGKLINNIFQSKNIKITPNFQEKERKIMVKNSVINNDRVF